MSKRADSRVYSMCSLLPVLWCVFSDFCAVSHPFELQRPAALSQTGEHESVPLQVCLCTPCLGFKVRRDVCEEKINNRMKTHA